MALLLAVAATPLLPASMPAAHASEAAAPVSVPAAASTAATPDAQPAAYPPAPKLTAKDYPTVKVVNSRVAVWLAAQLQLIVQLDFLLDLGNKGSIVLELSD